MVGDSVFLIRSRTQAGSNVSGTSRQAGSLARQGSNQASKRRRAACGRRPPKIVFSPVQSPD